MRKPHPLLALVAALMLWILFSYRMEGGIGIGEQFLYLGATLLLVLYGLWWLLVSRVDPEKPVSRMPRGVKVSLASLSLAWGLMFLMALALLPFMGPIAMQVLVGPWAPLLWIVGAFMIMPAVSRRLQ
jgi:hypothetical protein